MEGEIEVNNFSLKDTIESGQFFRYFPIEGWYYIVTRDRVFKVQQKENKIYFKGNTSASFLREFLGLDYDLSDFTKFANENNLGKLLERYPGLRVMKQDLWECLVSFICSSASNIKKIQLNLNLLSQSFGKPIKFEDKIFYSFPEPGSINNLEKIKNAKTGFRANYISNLNEIVDDNFLRNLKIVKYPKAKELLCELPGVGEKIADCVLLFSLSHKQAFPVDVWIKRVMETLYFSGEKTSIKKIRDFAVKEFGDHSGYVQQYLYHYGRNASGD